MNADDYVRATDAAKLRRTVGLIAAGTGVALCAAAVIRYVTIAKRP
jgi:hypothetical protein